MAESAAFAAGALAWGVRWVRVWRGHVDKSDGGAAHFLSWRERWNVERWSPERERAALSMARAAARAGFVGRRRLPVLCNTGWWLPAAVRVLRTLGVTPPPSTKWVTHPLVGASIKSQPLDSFEKHIKYAE